MIKTVICFLLLLFALRSTEAQSLRFAVISDPHVGRKGATKNLRKAIRSINADREVQFSLLLGDVSNNGTAAGHHKAHRLLAHLRQPLYVTSGNHDAKTAERYASFRHTFGTGDFCFDAGGYRFLGITTGPFEALRHATLGVEQTRQLQNACSDSLPVIVAAHHSPDLVAHTATAFAGIDSTRIVIWLAGHLHHNAAQKSLCPTAINLSTLDKGQYNRIEIQNGVLRIFTVTPRTELAECWYTLDTKDKKTK